MWTGYGEAGLPPKKPHVYFASYNDICQYVKCFTRELSKRIAEIAEDGGSGKSVSESFSYNPIAEFQGKGVFHSLWSDGLGCPLMSALFHCLDWIRDVPAMDLVSLGDK